MPDVENGPSSVLPLVSSIQSFHKYLLSSYKVRTSGKQGRKSPVVVYTLFKGGGAVWEFGKPIIT